VESSDNKVGAQEII